MVNILSMAIPDVEILGAGRRDFEGSGWV